MAWLSLIPSNLVFPKTKCHRVPGVPFKFLPTSLRDVQRRLGSPNAGRAGRAELLRGVGHRKRKVGDWANPTDRAERTGQRGSPENMGATEQLSFCSLPTFLFLPPQAPSPHHPYPNRQSEVEWGQLPCQSGSEHGPYGLGGPPRLAAPPLFAPLRVC